MPILLVINKSTLALVPLPAIRFLADVGLLFRRRRAGMRGLDPPHVGVGAFEVIGQPTGLPVRLTAHRKLATEHLFRVVVHGRVAVPLVVVVDDPGELLILFVTASDGA